MKLKRENKGFSLVELIVVIAIFSVVAVAVGGFLYTANRTYSVSATELDIQEEAQLVANQLQEMVMDSALGISYQYTLLNTDSSVDVGYATDDAEIPTTGALNKKELFIYGNDCYYIIYWKKDDSKLYYVEYKLDSSSGSYMLADGMTSDGVLLGEYISQFSVDMSKLASDRMVSFNLVFEKPGVGKRDYLVAKSVSLRNNVLVNKDQTTVWASSGTTIVPKADGINISPATPQTLWPGESIMYTVNLTCSLGGVPNQSVSWTCESGDGGVLNPATKVSGSGTFQVSPDEKCSAVKLKAIATGWNYSSDSEMTLSKELEVNIKQIQGLEIVKSDFESTTVAPGGTYTIDVLMTGRNISGMSATDAGGIGVSYLKGQQYVQLLNTQDLGGAKMRFTFKVNANAPEEAEIAMRFYALREGFTDVTADSITYKVQGIDTNLIGLSSATGNQWLRLGSSKVQVDVLSQDDYDRYCNSDGSLKEGYFMKYSYQLYDEQGQLITTAYKTTTSGANVYTNYFTSEGSSTAQKASVLASTDKMPLTSGSVVVKAELMSNTAGSIVTVAETNEVEYYIPEAVIGFKRTKNSAAETNLNLYITKKYNNAEFYITFSQGFAQQNYTISYDMMSCTPSELGGVNNNSSNLNDYKVVISGNTSDSVYSTSGKNALSFTYGGLTSSAVNVQFMNSNVQNRDYYVPAYSTSEWVSGGNSTYYYYMDSSHRMCLNNTTNVDATIQILTGNDWITEGALFYYEDGMWYIKSNVEGTEYYVPALSKTGWKKIYYSNGRDYRWYYYLPDGYYFRTSKNDNNFNKADLSTPGDFSKVDLYKYNSTTKIWEIS